MPNVSKLFLEVYPKKYIKRARKQAKQYNIKITKKGLYDLNGNKINIRKLSELFNLLQLQHINPEEAHMMYGGIGETKKFKVPGGVEVEVYAAPPRKKLNINPSLLNFLEASYGNKAAEMKGEQGQPIPEFRQAPIEDIPLAPPLAPPIAPPLAPSFGPPMIQPQYMQAPYYPAPQHNFIQELKDYKEGIEYIKSMCPLLKRTYVTKAPGQKQLKEQQKIEKILKIPQMPIFNQPKKIPLINLSKNIQKNLMKIERANKIANSIEDATKRKYGILPPIIKRSKAIQKNMNRIERANRIAHGVEDARRRAYGII